MARTPLKAARPTFVAIAAVELVSAALAWRDLARRSENQIRGRKTV